MIYETKRNIILEREIMRLYVNKNRVPLDNDYKAHSSAVQTGDFLMVEKKK